MVDGCLHHQFRRTSRCSVQQHLASHAGGLGQWPSVSEDSVNRQGSDVASIHSKLDQLIAAYTNAATPRGGVTPESIFSLAGTPRSGTPAGPLSSPAQDRQASAGADAALANAESIAPSGRFSASSRLADAKQAAGDPFHAGADGHSTSSPAKDRAFADDALSLPQPEAAVDPALSPAPFSADAHSALSAASGKEVHGSRPTLSSPSKVRFSFIASDTNADMDLEASDERHHQASAATDPVNTAAAVAAASTDQGVDTDVENSSASTQSASANGSSPGSAGATSKAAAAVPAIAEAAEPVRQAVPLSGAGVKPRGTFKKLLQRVLH